MWKVKIIFKTCLYKIWPLRYKNSTLRQFNCTKKMRVFKTLTCYK